LMREFLEGTWIDEKVLAADAATIDMSKPGWQRFIEEKLQEATQVCADSQRWRALLLVLESLDGTNPDPSLLIRQKNRKGECVIEARFGDKFAHGIGRSFEEALQNFLSATRHMN